MVPLVLLLFMHYCGILTAATHKRTGRNGMFIASGILLLVFTFLGFLASYLNWYPAIFGWMVKQSAVDYTLWMLPFLLLFAVASYLLLRRATV
jgi:H+/Cl- antiporter ClcA